MDNRKIAEIRRMYYEDNFAVEVIAARKGYCTNTIYRYLKPEYESGREKDNARRASKIEPYVPIIRAWLVEDKSRFYKQRHTAQRVYDRLRAEVAGFSCSYPVVQRTYKTIRDEVYGSAAKAEAEIPIAGLCEVGCSGIEFTYKGKAQKGHVVCLAFPHSNATYIQIVMGLNTECILEALQNIFAYVGGVPQGVKFSSSTKLFKHFNQMPCDIDDELLTRFNLYYKYTADYFIPVCEGTNTVVVSLMKYYRRCIIPLRQKFDDLAAFNADLLPTCDKLQNRKTNRDKVKTCAELFAEDKAALLPMPAVPFAVMSWQKRKINSRGELMLDGKHCYFLPHTLVNRKVYVCLTPDKIIIKNLDNAVVQEFDRIYSDEPENVQNVADLIAALRTKSNALLYTSVRDMLPASVIEFLREHRKATAGFAAALYDFTQKMSFENAVKILEVAAVNGLTKKEDIVALDKGDTV
jgi:hypothetical protein